MTAPKVKVLACSSRSLLTPKESGMDCNAIPGTSRFRKSLRGTCVSRSLVSWCPSRGPGYPIPCDSAHFPSRRIRQCRQFMGMTPNYLSRNLTHRNQVPQARSLTFWIQTLLLHGGVKKQPLMSACPGAN